MFVNSTTTIQIKKNESFKKLHQIVFKELLNIRSKHSNKTHYYSSRSI